MVGLLVAVAIAARGGHPNGHGKIVERSIPHGLQDSLVTLLAVTYVLVAVIGVIVVYRYRGRWREPKSHWLRSSILLTALLVAITLGYYAIARRPPPPPPEQIKIAHELNPAAAPPRGGVPPRHARFEWPLALAVVGLVVIAGTTVFIYSRRRSSLDLAGTVEEDLAQVVETTIEDLRREPDARRAVIAAYANMERVLSAHGLGRRGAETPFEYLAHVLRERDVRESAVRQLTKLFEYAKFSAHEIDSAMKEEAIGALENVRDDLRGQESLAA